jgi:hypothetical protein
MNVPISGADILELMLPGQLPSIADMERAAEVIKLIAAAKSIAIDQLEVTLKEVREQNRVLQAHNTELLLRARKAEGEAAELRTAIDLQASASHY